MNKRSRLSEPLFDLKKRFPDYFSVWVFRSALLLILLFSVFVSYSNDWRVSWSYAECPLSYDLVPCTVVFKSNAFSDSENIIIPAGQSWGYKPNWVGEHFVSIVFFILGGSFVVNHLLAKRRKL